MKKIISILMVLVLSLTACLSLAGCSSNDGPTTFTVWIPSDDSGEFYEEYGQNPVINYIENYMEFNGQHIDLEFAAAPTSGAQDVLNTLFSTGDTTEIMDSTMATMSHPQMYEDGLILDLTDYILEYCPHYVEYMNTHPDAKRSAVTYYDRDGDGELEECYFCIEIVNTGTSQEFEGYLYRRDWILKYGVHPEGSAKAGQPFSGGYDANGVWSDDITFPSYYTEVGKVYKENIDPDWDGTVPVFISDWEWMFEIFTKAQADLGITDGYCISVYNYGYNPGGEIVSAFGGKNNGNYYYDEDTDEFCQAITTNEFREYLSTMNIWYEKGWLDNKFATRTELFWEIDTTTVYAGKVGMWLGYLQAASGSNLDNDDYPYTKGIYVTGARMPINDKYSTYSEKAKFSADNIFVPESFFGSGTTGDTFVITKKAENKDLVTLFTFIDWCYNTDENEILTFGLTDEQIKQVAGEEWGAVYAENGITTMGFWNEDHTVFTFDEKFYDPTLDGLKGALTVGRIFGCQQTAETALYGTKEFIDAHNEKIFYTNTCYGKYNWVESYVDTKDVSRLNNISTNVSDLLNKSAQQFIFGKDLNVKDDWDAFVKKINSFGLQELVDYNNGLLKKFSNISNK